MGFGSKNFFVLVIVFLLALALGACGIFGGGKKKLDFDEGGAPPPSGGSDDGNEILIGYVTSFTGPLSFFTEATKWADEMCLDVINNSRGGIEADGVNKKIRVIYGDSESNPDTAKAVAEKMVRDNDIDILVGAWTLVNGGPVSEVGELHGIPTYISNSPAEPWIASDSSGYWAMGSLYYIEDQLTNVMHAFDQLNTNKKVGFLFDDEEDSIAIAEIFTPMLEKEGYKVFNTERFSTDKTDFSDIITEFKNENCDIVSVNMTGFQFAGCLRQFYDNDYIPKVFNIGKALRFQNDLAELGPGFGEGFLTEALWDRSFPYTSPLLGMNCEGLAQRWEEEKETQFPSTLGYDVSLWEVLSDSLMRARTTEPEALRAAILAADLDSIFGRLSFNKNQVAKVPCVTAQWSSGEKWIYEKTIVSAATTPQIPSEPPFILPGTTQSN